MALIGIKAILICDSFILTH